MAKKVYTEHFYIDNFDNELIAKQFGKILESWIKKYPNYIIISHSFTVLEKIGYGVVVLIIYDDNGYVK